MKHQFEDHHSFIFNKKYSFSRTCSFNKLSKSSILPEIYASSLYVSIRLCNPCVQFFISRVSSIKGNLFSVGDVVSVSWLEDPEGRGPSGRDPRTSLCDNSIDF